MGRAAAGRVRPHHRPPQASPVAPQPRPGLPPHQTPPGPHPAARPCRCARPGGGNSCPGQCRAAAGHATRPPPAGAGRRAVRERGERQGRLSGGPGTLHRCRRCQPMPPPPPSSTPPKQPGPLPLQPHAHLPVVLEAVPHLHNLARHPPLVAVLQHVCGGSGGRRRRGAAEAVGRAGAANGDAGRATPSATPPATQDGASPCAPPMFHARSPSISPCAMV